MINEKLINKVSAMEIEVSICMINKYIFLLVDIILFLPLVVCLETGSTSEKKVNLL